tara:strand:+ start:186 stop:1961 length:1776 start_codon:yes stop_codon:yes gene_type:complete
MSRFLITTFDERTWKKNEKILFLGEWCKRFSRKAIWSQLDQKVLPYHWNNRKQMFVDYQYLQEVYEKYLEILSQNLNRIHNENHSNEYWRIVLGPWLQLFICIVFDKWLSIKGAIDTEEISSTWIIEFGKEGIVPFGMNEMLQLLYSESWHHHIYSQIIIANKQIPYKKVEQDLSYKKLEFTKTSNFSLKSSIKNIISCICRQIPDSLNKTVFIGTNFFKWDLFKLQISLGQIPYLVDSEIKLKKVPVQEVMRKNLVMDQASNEFEVILESLIPSNIPKLNLELYSDICNHILRIFPKKVSTIVTTHGYWSEEEVKLWAAKKKEQGAKLVICQHGGTYGSGLIEQSEDHQIKICDRFFTWGWKEPKYDHVRPLSPPKLAPAIKEKIYPKPSGPILWVLGADFPLYFFRMTSIPFAAQCLEYYNDQISFGKNISKEVLKVLKLRLRPKGRFSWEEDKYLREAGLGEIMEFADKDLHKRLNESRLCVTTDNSTVFLETLASNYPTILFWNPTHWPLRPSAEPFYDELKRMNILHDSPESAAELVNKIFKNPSDWWFHPERQRVIKSFCKEFAFIRADWLADWKKELKTLSSKR